MSMTKTERWAELHVAVDPDDLPLAMVFGDQVTIAVGDDATITCELQVPLDRVREWAGDLYAAVSVAYREATGDPHALSDEELAMLPPADAYDPGPGPLVTEDEHGPAVVRFHVAVDVQARCLDVPALRAALVEALAGRFNTIRVAVSAGEPLAGRVR